MRLQKMMVLVFLVGVTALSCKKNSPSSPNPPRPTSTPTFAYTPVPSATSTDTATSTQTFTYSSTQTHTATTILTDTFTRTFTPTFSHTPTHSLTVTSTPTDTHTFTNTSTRTFTHTPTPTFTSTQTPSFTETGTPTSTPTATHTFTVTNTPLFGVERWFGFQPPYAVYTPIDAVFYTSPYDLPQDGTVRAIWCTSNYSAPSKVGIYTDAGGVPGNLIVSSSGWLIPTSEYGSWSRVPIPYTALTAGKYWLGVCKYRAKYVTGMPGTMLVNTGSSFDSGNWPATYPGADVVYPGSQLAVWAEYCVPPDCATETPTASLTPTPTSTYTLTLTDTPSPTPTLSPTFTVTATPTMTPLTYYTLTISRTGTGAGAVSSSPAGINCGSTCSQSFVSGTVLRLTAFQDATSAFTGWSGGGCSGTGTCDVTVDGDKTVTAQFTRFTPTSTPTPSNTYTSTPTDTHTPTFTDTPSSTPTETFTVTHTPTRSFTFTETHTPTHTGTPTNSPTPTTPPCSPFASDANTTLLEHFDGSVTGNPVGLVRNSCASYSAAPPIVEYVAAPSGFGQALQLRNPTATPGAQPNVSYLGYSPSLLGSTGSIELRVYPIEYPFSLFSGGPDPWNCGGWMFHFSVNSDGYPTAYLSGTTVTGTQKVPLNAWSTLTLSWTTASCQVYIDRTLVGAAGASSTSFGSRLMFFAGGGNGAMLVDELRLSNSARVPGAACGENPFSQPTLQVTYLPTATWTGTPSLTRTHTLTPTVTLTSTDTFSPTSTNTPTSTPTATQTSTLTSTFTHTSSSTFTHTFTPTLTPVCFSAYGFGRMAGGNFTSANRYMATAFSLVDTGQVTAVNALFSGAGTGRAGIYSNGGSGPGTLVASSAASAVTNGWNRLEIPDVVLPPGTYYLAAEGYGNSVYGQTGTSSTVHYNMGFDVYNWPATYPGAEGTNAGYEVCVWAEYCLTGGASTYTPTSTPTFTQTYTPTNTLTPTYTVSLNSPTPTETRLCAAGYNFGRTADGNFGAYNRFMATAFNVADAGTVTAVWARFMDSGQGRTGIYSDGGSAPGTLIALSAVSPTGTGWNRLEIPDTYLPPGRYYLAAEGYGNAATGQTGTSSTIQYHTGFDAYNWPSAYPGGGGTNAGYELCVYAEYCLPGGATYTPTPTRTSTLSPTQTPTPTITSTSTATWMCFPPSVIGNANWGNNTYGSGPFMATAYTLPVNGTVIALQASFGGSSTGRAGLYTNNAGVPGTLIVASEIQAVGNGWNRFDIVDTYLPSGSYFLVFAGLQNRLKDGMPGNTIITGDISYTSFPANYSASGITFIGGEASIQAEYCP